MGALARRRVRLAQDGEERVLALPPEAFRGPEVVLQQQTTGQATVVTVACGSRTVAIEVPLAYF